MRGPNKLELAWGPVFSQARATRFHVAQSAKAVARTAAAADAADDDDAAPAASTSFFGRIFGGAATAAPTATVAAAATPPMISTASIDYAPMRALLDGGLADALPSGLGERGVGRLGFPPPPHCGRAGLQGRWWQRLGARHACAWRGAASRESFGRVYSTMVAED